MRILFDQNIPAPMIPFLRGHAVTKAKDVGWDRLEDGSLLAAADKAGFELLVTADRQIRWQQNLAYYDIALVVLGNHDWNIARRYVRRIAAAVDAATPGTYTEVEIPFR